MTPLIASAAVGSGEVSGLVVAGVFALLTAAVTAAGAIVVALVRMKRSNTVDHGQVITELKLLTVGQEQLSNIVVRHIQHDHNQRGTNEHHRRTA
jgi:hypothetical protein